MFYFTFPMISLGNVPKPVVRTADFILPSRTEVTTGRRGYHSGIFPLPVRHAPHPPHSHTPPPFCSVFRPPERVQITWSKATARVPSLLITDIIRRAWTRTGRNKSDANSRNARKRLTNPKISHFCFFFFHSMSQNTGETEMRDISPQEYTYQKKFPPGWDWAAKPTEHTQSPHTPCSFL